MGWGTQEGKSVATLWGEMVSAAERGEVRGHPEPAR